MEALSSSSSSSSDLYVEPGKAPGTSSPFIRATAAERVASFVAASVALGVPEEEALQPHHVLAGPHRSAAAVLRAMRAFAAVAHARGVGPAWDA